MSKKDDDKKHRKYIDLLKQDAQAKIGVHWVKSKEPDLEEIVEKMEKEHWNVPQVAAQLAREYYNNLELNPLGPKGEDGKRIYNEDHEVLGVVRRHISPENYRNFIGILESGDMYEALKHLKESHREHDREMQNETLMAEIPHLDDKVKEALSKEVIQYMPEWKEGDHKVKPDELYHDLHRYVQHVAQHEQRMESVKGYDSKTFRKRVKDLYEASKKKDGHGGGHH